MDTLQKQIQAIRAAIRKWPSMMLDNLYIRVDVEAAYRAESERLGKAIENLTEQERMNAVLTAYISRVPR